MKFSRILIVGLLSASCSDGAVTDQQALTSESPAAEQQAGTTGEREEARRRRQRRRSPASAPTPIADQAKAVGVNPDAAVLQDFKARVDAYMKLRKEAVKGAPKLKETNDPAKIKESQDAMSAQIRAARVNAKHGDVLTPEMAAAFRRALYPELKGDDGRDAKAHHRGRRADQHHVQGEREVSRGRIAAFRAGQSAHEAADVAGAAAVPNRREASDPAR